MPITITNEELRNLIKDFVQDSWGYTQSEILAINDFVNYVERIKEEDK